MSELKHTTGPWEATFTDILGCSVDGYCRIRPTNREMFGHHTSLEIATLHLIDEVEQQANARLIAAAPDLLEALINLERVSGMASMRDDPGRVAARAAIAKATGSEP